MSKTAPVGTVITAHAEFTKPDGTDGKVFGVPVWKSVNPTIWDPNTAPGSVSADGLTASGPVLAVGDTDVSVTGEGDAAAGVDTVVITGHVTGTDVEVSGGKINFD